MCSLVWSCVEEGGSSCFEMGIKVLVEGQTKTWRLKSAWKRQVEESMRVGLCQENVL